MTIKPSKQVSKQMKQPKVSKIEEINKLWYHNLRNRQSLALIPCEYYLVVQKYIPLTMLSKKNLVIIDTIKMKQNKINYIQLT